MQGKVCIGVYEYEKALKSGKPVRPIVKREKRFLIVEEKQSKLPYSHLWWRCDDKDCQHVMSCAIFIEFTESIHFN
jgi:hypothetical protein